MNSEDGRRSERRSVMWIGCGVLALVTIAGAVAQRTAGAHAAVAVASVYAGGLLFMAWLTSRVTRYPLWAWFASSGVLVLTLAVVATEMHTPAQVKDWSSMAWMYPWLYLVMGMSPAPATRHCSPRAIWGGPLLVATSVVFSSILFLAVWLAG